MIDGLRKLSESIKQDMTSKKKTITFLFLLFFIICDTKAQEAEELNNESKSLYPALLGGLFTNTLFHLTSRLFGADFAQTDLESIKTNLTSPWIWDNDVFLLNNPGHAYQGGWYHAAARANGFNFYESIFFDALGSLTWELFAETDIPSLNDLVVTTLGGAAFGEMLHRLFLEIGSPWAATLVSPIDTFNGAVWKRKPQRTYNIYYLTVMSGPGWTKAIKENKEQLKDLSKNNIDPASSSIYTGNISCDVIYGNPFTNDSAKPYSQFEIKMQIGFTFSPLWLDWTILTDGYLFSFNPLYTEKNMLSTGLTLHYDSITGNNINFASNALDWTIKWRKKIKTTYLELKTHFGWTIFGSSEYYPYSETNDMNLYSNKTENDFGTGGNLKIYFTIQTQKYGKLTLSACNYLLYIIPWNKPDSQGIEFFNLSFLEYSFPFAENFSLFVNSSLYLKSGNSRRKNDVVSIADRIILGIQWTFLDKGNSW